MQTDPAPLKGNLKGSLNESPKETPQEKKPLWSQELLHSYTSVADLLKGGLITSDEADKLALLGDLFQTRITPYYSKLMIPSPHCPIRLQAIPHLGEEDPTLPDWATQASLQAYGRTTPWLADAIGDVRNLAAPRITHRYENRAILHLLHCVLCIAVSASASLTSTLMRMRSIKARSIPRSGIWKGILKFMSSFSQEEIRFPLQMPL